MSNLFQSRNQAGPALFDGNTSASGLRADRTDISFQNVTPDLVRVEVRVTNDGTLWSPATEVTLRSAALGAFLPWHPLMSLTVPSLAPRTSTVISGTAWAIAPAPLAKTEEECWTMPPHLLQEFADNAAREAREEAEREARRLLRRPAPMLTADAFALVGRNGVHWAGNIDVLMRGKEVERHMAMAIRVYPGKTNAAAFYVGDRADGYKFELSGEVEDWKAEVIDMSHAASMKPGKGRTAPIGEFREFTRGTFSLVMHPPKDAERGGVLVHVSRQSDGKEATVEFSLDSRAAGAGCYKI